MRRAKLIYMLLFLLISSSISAQENLNDYLKFAAENNPGLKAKFSEYMAALEKVPQVKALPDPQVAFAYFIQPVETRVGPQQLKFSASQMFPWFGTLKIKEDVASQLAKVKYEAFMESRSKLFNEVRSSFYNNFFNRKAFDIINENLEILQLFHELANSKIVAGLSSPIDEYRIEMEIGDLQNQYANLKDLDTVLEVQFKQLLNADDDFQLKIPEQLNVQNLDLYKAQILDSILSNNHQLLVLSMQQDALIYQKELAENQGKPAFSLGFDYTIVGKGENNLAGTDAFMFPKVGINIPLYRNKYHAMVNEVMHLQTAKQFERNDRENLLKTILEKAWKDYQDAGRRIELFQSQRNLAKLSLKLLESEYSTGNSNFEEILRMERKLLNYSLAFEKAQTDKQAAISFIHYLMGK